MSVLMGMVIIPALAARNKNPKRGLKRALIQVVMFNLFYLFALLFIWGRL
jgi:hypothetical protein